MRSKLSRRRFGQGVAATAIVVGLGGSGTLAPALADGRARSFGAELDPSVWVRMGAWCSSATRAWT